MGRGYTAVQLGPELFNAIENQLRQNSLASRTFNFHMDRLVRFMSYVHLGAAQRRSLGPVDPQQQRPELAWKLPVRRISGRYFFGWKVKRRGLGWWQVYNDSREAYFIEFGIHTSNRRVRRPVNKLALMATLKFMATTRAYDRVWADIYMPPPGMRRGRGFIWQMQSPPVELRVPTMERLS